MGMQSQTTCALKDEARRTRRRDSEEYSMVIVEGGYRIALNGEVIGSFFWRSSERDDCLRTLRRLGGPEALP